MRSPLPISPESPASAVLWYAVLGAPIAWGLQFASGYWISVAQCSPAGARWDVSVQAWAIAIGAVCLAAALGAGATAAALFRRTREAPSSPPAGRIHFLATIGLAICPLFAAMIVMSTVGVLILFPCAQS
jgi:hypothetical protein